MRQWLTAFSALVLLTLCAASSARAQVGPLVWEENFNTLDQWIKVTGNGDWGWGNGELECYREQNVDIFDVPGEPGNKALRIIGRAESGAGITDQYGNPLNFTSGKVMSKSHVSVRYGMIETRVQVPGLVTGGWPAVWLLGTSTKNWPTCGEIDLMEMGAKKVFRDLHDSHNGGDGLHHSTENQMVGANAIYYSPSAVGPGNTAGAASLAYDPTDIYDRPYYNLSSGLTGRFLIYRLYWDTTSMRFTVVDNGVEHDLYTTPFTLTQDADEFQQPFYFLANLAIGGAYTDAQQLYNPGAGVPISMPLPATMLVDYIRVYEWNGHGEVAIGPPTPQTGTFGLYTDTTPVTGGLEPGVTSDIYVWENTLVNGTIAPYEGTNVLSWKTNGIGWFGAGIMARQPVNLYDFGPGFVSFKIKIPANVTFKIGLIDAWGNQNYVDFPANTTKYGLVRNGNWGTANVPLLDLRGLAIDLRMLSYTFVILEQSGTACEFALDDIVWTGGNLPAGVAPPVTTGSTALLASAPNPFKSGTELRFTLAKAQPYELGIFDAAGHRVTSFRGIGHAGINGVRWNGQDDRGHRAAPGVYYYRLDSGGVASSHKLVRLD